MRDVVRVTGFARLNFTNLAALHFLGSSCFRTKNGSGEIRTRDLCVPNAESYQARPRSQQTKTIAQFKTIDRIPSCQKITIIKSEIHNLIVFLFYAIIFHYAREKP